MALPLDPVEIVASAALAVLVTILTLSLKSTRPKSMLALFISILTVLVVLAILGLDTYPFSDVLVLGFAVLGGSLIGRKVWKHTSVFLGILISVSALDILSFVSGPNSPSTSQPASAQGGSSLLQYLNFTIQYGANRYSNSTHFMIGSFDMLVLSMVVLFFALEGLPRRKVFLLGLAAFLLPYVYLLTVTNTSGGLPLLPFISVVAFAALLVNRPAKSPGSVSTSVRT